MVENELQQNSNSHNRGRLMLFCITYTPAIESCALLYSRYENRVKELYLRQGVLGGQQLLLVEGGVDLLALSNTQGSLTSDQVVLVAVVHLQHQTCRLEQAQFYKWHAWDVCLMLNSEHELRSSGKSF